MEITRESHPEVWKALLPTVRHEMSEVRQALVNTNNPTFRPTVRVNQER